MKAHSRRPDLRKTTCADEPLVQRRPKFAGCSLSPDTLTTSAFSTCRTMPQPTQQYGHTVLTLPEIMIDSRTRVPCSYRDPYVSIFHARGEGAHRVLRYLDAFARAKVVVMLEDRRCHHNSLAKIADQSARQHRRLRTRVEVIDRKHAGVAIGEMEHSDLLAVDECTDPGVGHDVVEPAHRHP